MLQLVAVVWTIAVNLLSAANAWTWPNPQFEDLDSARWDIDGYAPRLAIGAGLRPDCTPWIRGPGHGRSNAADWVRTAFHDMATYDPVTGMGGLDASIRLEAGRPENAGNGFSMTLLFFRNSPGRYLSMADILALALVGVFEHCGGPELEWRGGRIDANAENDPQFTAPHPSETLQTHTETFARLGFNQTEMVGLVACGHTFASGVQKTAFPDLVPELNDLNNTESNAPFDSTVVHFDNNIAIQYVDGTTANPLVVNADDTFNSDKRIFGSDGSQTMAAFAGDSSLFAQTCATLFTRMINIVPSGVQLTEVVTPLTVKPRGVELVHRGDGFLSFIGEVRLWNLPENSARQVRLVWHDRNGTQSSNTTHTSNMVGAAAGGRYRTEWYSWKIPLSVNDTTTPLTEALGMTGMHFEVQESAGGPWAVEDQQGLGFAIADTAMFSETSCKTGTTFPFHAKYRVAVRRSDLPPHRVFLTGDAGIVLGLPTFETIEVLPPVYPTPTTSSYDIWEADLDENEVFGKWWLSVESTNSSGHIDVALERRPMDFKVGC